MIQLILFLGIGALLLTFLLLLARRNPRPEGGAEALVEARQTLTQLKTGLLPPQLVDRFFAEGDFEYVAFVAPGPVNALFRRERKKIALAWIDQVRRHIRSLRRFHLGAARFYARMGFRSEVALAMDFTNLLIACRALQVLVYFGGPRVAPRMIGTTVAAGTRICQVYEEALAFLSTPASAADHSIAS